MRKAAAISTPITDLLRADCIRLPLGQSVGRTLDGLRGAPPAGRIVYFYVVDEAGRLEGVVPPYALLVGARERPIDEIMMRRVVALPETATLGDACELFALHRFLSLPVVDAERRLLGVVDIEVYTDDLTQLNDAEKRADLFQAIGVHAGTETEVSPWRAFARRFPWLGSNLAGGLACAAMASLFKAELARVVALSLFIPVVLNLAESVSSQSVSLTLHVLRGEIPSWRFVARSLRHELATGLLLGLACGAVVGLAALVGLGDARLGLVLVAGIAGGVVVSALLGVALPVALRLFALDPKVAAGPIALASADVATLLAYLCFARWLLR